MVQDIPLSPGIFALLAVLTYKRRQRQVKLEILISQLGDVANCLYCFLATTCTSRIHHISHFICRNLRTAIIGDIRDLNYLICSSRLSFLPGCIHRRWDTHLSFNVISIGYRHQSLCNTTSLIPRHRPPKYFIRANTSQELSLGRLKPLFQITKRSYFVHNTIALRVPVHKLVHRPRPDESNLRPRLT